MDGLPTGMITVVTSWVAVMAAIKTVCNLGHFSFSDKLVIDIQ